MVYEIFGESVVFVFVVDVKENYALGMQIEGISIQPLAMVDLIFC